MPICTGSDYILSIVINENEVVRKIVHEKEDKCWDKWGAYCTGTACIVTKESEILIYDYKNNVMNDEIYTTVDNINVFYIPSIIEEYYNQCEMDKRDEQSICINKIFTDYMAALLKENLEDFEKTYEIDDFAHYVMTVPDSWDSHHNDTAKQIMADTKIKYMEDITIVHQSQTLLSYLQLPHYGYSFYEGHYYIVCHMEEWNQVTVYGYDIGPPIKGLHSIASHTLTYTEKFSIDYFKQDFLKSILFGWNSEEAEKYKIGIDKIHQLCYGNYWTYSKRSDSMYELLEHYKSGFLNDMDKSFFRDKEAILKAITFSEVKEASPLAFSDIEEVVMAIDLLSQKHRKVKVVVISESSMVQESHIAYYISNSQTEYPITHHTVKATGRQVPAIGAVHMIQNHLELQKYIPQIEKKESLENIANGNIVYINMKWNNNSVLFVNPKKERTVIEDTSYTIDNCYNLSECFRIDNDEHYNSRDMNITDKFIQMVRFDKKPVPQPTKKTKSKGKPSTKKNISSSKKITLNDLSIKIQLSIISKYFFPEPSLINEYKEIIPREKYQKLISFYADSLQIYIRQHLISREYIKKTDKLEIYFTMDSEIQDVFDTDYEDVRSIFLTIMDESYPAQPMSHILAEQITGTYCKNILKCYEQVEDYLDYPQYVVQVHLYPEYMNFTLNAILPLDMNVESTKNETVLTLKREKIQFNMVDVFADALWDYIQSIEECPVKCCSKHQLSNYEEDIEMYHVFIKQFKLYITKQFTMNNKERTTDWHNPIDIPISSKCTCTCSITLADLFEVCITPAIDQLTSTIYASTIEKSISGNHKISHLVIMGTPFKLKCVNFTNHLLNLLKTTMDNTKQYSNPIPTHWVEDSIPNVIDQGMMSIINNPSGGLLEQISPGQYYLSFNKDATFHLLEWKKMEAYETGTAHIDNRERIDLNMRNDGYFRIFYINEENVTIYLYHKANEEHFSKAKCIEQYEYSRPDMYPVINRSVHGLGQVSFSFFTEHERVTPLDDTNICQIPIRDIILLSPFVLVE